MKNSKDLYECRVSNFSFWIPLLVVNGTFEVLLPYTTIWTILWCVQTCFRNFCIFCLRFSIQISFSSKGSWL